MLQVVVIPCPNIIRRSPTPNKLSLPPRREINQQQSILLGLGRQLTDEPALEDGALIAAGKKGQRDEGQLPTVARTEQTRQFSRRCVATTEIPCGVGTRIVHHVGAGRIGS